MKKWQRRALAAGLTLIALLGIGHAALRLQVHHPAARAWAAAETATLAGSTLLFGAPTARLTVVVYPGAFVEPAAYADWAASVAAAGYRVAIVRFPYDLAVLAGGQASTVLTQGQRYVIGGHSLGGVMASRYAAAHAATCAGVFFLASYPDAQGQLPATMPVLSLTASRDGVLNRPAYRKAQALLPETTETRQLAGGNHAGFGAYGHQRGDHPATVSVAAQNRWVAAQLIGWLDGLQ
ncbi:alpha/beta hydrolase [Lacticaseibacillus absianus]|uniref:alpha/beta hydrolase n=1 Tax=Lacticaseibacillus absianus TaxID=2729623 RepID=UPI0015C8E43C|nr:alpha/beta hydrolase [Lacticaseibacillus absianus]